jgi:hypothetical protein
LLLIACIVLMVPFSVQRSYLDSVFLVPNLVRLANQQPFKPSLKPWPPAKVQLASTVQHPVTMQLPPMFWPNASPWLHLHLQRYGLTIMFE